MLKIFKKYNKFKKKPVINHTYDVLNRRVNTGELKPIPSSFHRFRNQILDDKLLPDIYHLLKDNPNKKEYEKLLSDPDYAKCDDRLIENSWLLLKLFELKLKNKIQFLDVGCVLNNSSIKPYLEEFTQMMWFLNPALEKLKYDQNLGYIITDIRKNHLPNFFQFDVVSCFSTLEHIGMDNQRYGGGPAEFQGLIDDPEKYAIDALKKIVHLVKSKGRLFISVPYGPFEYVYIYSKPNDPIYYSFDKQRILKLQNALEGFQSKISIYKIVPDKGWVETDLKDNDILKHAENCVSAGALALIEAEKI